MCDRRVGLYNRFTASLHADTPVLHSIFCIRSYGCRRRAQALYTSLLVSQHAMLSVDGAAVPRRGLSQGSVNGCVEAPSLTFCLTTNKQSPRNSGVLTQETSIF